jgi:hypothetical protein
MGQAWTDQIAQYLSDSKSCPRCDHPLEASTRCSNCGADLSTEVAENVWQASIRAAAILRSRQRFIDQLPLATPAPAPPTPLPQVTPVSSGTDARQPAPTSQVSVQSVLAVAGAGLFAIAAIVFTFLNPDLTSFGGRTIIVGVVTALFVGAAWLLARTGLQFSGESVGALGMVFLILDIWALSQAASTSAGGLLLAGIGTAASAALVVALAALVKIRTWLWCGVVGLSIAPGFVGSAGDTAWTATIGITAVAFAAVGTHSVINRTMNRFTGRLVGMRVTATVIQTLAMAVALCELVFLPASTAAAGALGRCAFLLSLAVVAALATRSGGRRSWSLVGGALVSGAFATLPFALGLNPTWYPALVPIATGVGLVVLCVTPTPHTMDRRLLLVGGWSIVLVASTPAIGLAVYEFAGLPGFSQTALWGLSSIFGLLAAAASSWILPRFGGPRGGRVVGSSLAIAAILSCTRWSALSPAAQIGVAVGTALAAAVLLRLFDRVTDAPVGSRVQLFAAAHVALLIAATIAASDPPLGVIVIAALAAVARVVPARIRPLHFGVGYAYALAIFATAASLAGLDVIAILCLVTSLASAFALAVTMTRWTATQSWYAVLIVTAVPFLMGILSVLLVRSGWTALSTAVTFGLAFALLTTRRPGMNLRLRIVAAGLLVPALSVVIICLGAQLLTVSASPIVLPLIAVVVACTLPSTGLIGAALQRHGLPQRDVLAARLSIEASSLATAGLAVLVALARAAAGLQTSLVVLVVLGAGATATAIWRRRQYAWWVAGCSFTGALWCVWAMNAVSTIEPYLVPPGIAAMIVGAGLVRKRSSGIVIFIAGLAIATIPSLFALGVSGSGSTVPVRSLGLLVGAVALVAIGAATTRMPGLARHRAIGIPSLGFAIAVASAGSIQAVRYAWAADPVATSDAQQAVWPVLVFTLAGVLLAAVAGRVLVDAARSRRPDSRLAQSRLLLVPALAYLAVGPVAATRPGWLPIFILLALAIVLLTGMLVTVARARKRPVMLPPAWLTFLVAWCVAVAGWSERALRVEAFSLSLGIALLAAGVIAMRPPATPPVRVGPTSWPIGFRGSWPLLGPGIVVTLLPSMLATGTDPLTLRAILVIGLALAAILVGSLRKLAAPFVLGLVALPIENIVVFVVQIGRSIGALPWWITLATAGAVLLVIAVTSERRVAGQRGVAARMRDLR